MARSNLGLLLLDAEPAGAQPVSRWSPARARKAGAGRNDLDAGEHRPTLRAQEQAVPNQGLDNKEGSEACRRGNGQER